MSKCSSGEKAVTRNAYLLFYRRRSSTPLGPASLQAIVQGETNPDSEPDSENEARSRSPIAGNGSRLGDLSRNGLSRAGAAGAGAGVLGAGGSALSGVGTHHANGAEAEILTDDDPPAFDEDEGYGDYEEGNFAGINTGSGDMYEPLSRYDDTPAWSFDGVKSSNRIGDDSDDVASDAPNLGSESDDDNLACRLIKDFGDDDLNVHAGESTPVEGIPPRLGGEEGDGEVTEIRIANN